MIAGRYRTSSTARDARRGASSRPADPSDQTVADGAPADENDMEPVPLWRRLLSWLFTLAVVALVVLLWPARLGGDTRFVMVAGDSMEPTFDFGDLVVTRDRGMPELGEPVVFAVPEGTGEGLLVIHRIIEVDGDGSFVTQGDNRETPDQWRLTSDDVVGEPVLNVPDGGHLVWFLQQWWVISILVGLLAIFLLWPPGDDEPGDDEASDEEASEVRRTSVDAALAEESVVVASAEVPVEPEPEPAVVARAFDHLGADAFDVLTDDTAPISTPISLRADTAPVHLGDDSTAVPEPIEWSDKEIDPAVMDDAVAWLDAQLDGLLEGSVR